MKEIRIRFKKLGRAKYISHLDLTRTMTRAVRRAGIPVWYTEGFNRHPYMTFAAPLSLGVEGMTESMDIRLIEDMPMDELVTRLNDAAPEGLSVYAAGEPVMKAGDIAYASYILTFSGYITGFDDFVAQESITVQKKSKKGVLRLLELKPYLEKASFSKENNGAVVIEMTLPCSSAETINPILILTAFNDFLDKQDIKHQPVFCDVKRLDILDAEGRPFA